MAQIIAVLTGDVVGSRDLGAEGLDRLFTALEAAVSEMAGWPGQTDNPPFARYRGDGWQLALTNPALALRATLVARGAVKAADKRFDTRIGVGIGGADKFMAEDIGGSSGEAFERAAQALDGLKRHQRLGIVPGERPASESDLLRGLFSLCGALTDEWTARQAEAAAILMAREDLTQAEIGQRMNPPIDQQAVADNLGKGHAAALADAVEAFESVIWKNK